MTDLFNGRFHARSAPGGYQVWDSLHNTPVTRPNGQSLAAHQGEAIACAAMANRMINPEFLRSTAKEVALAKPAAKLIKVGDAFTISTATKGGTTEIRITSKKRQHVYAVQHLRPEIASLPCRDLIAETLLKIADHIEQPELPSTEEHRQITFLLGEIAFVHASCRGVAIKTAHLNYSTPITCGHLAIFGLASILGREIASLTPLDLALQPLFDQLPCRPPKILSSGTSKAGIRLTLWPSHDRLSGQSEPNMTAVEKIRSSQKIFHELAQLTPNAEEIIQQIFP